MGHGAGGSALLNSDRLALHLYLEYLGVPIGVTQQLDKDGTLVPRTEDPTQENVVTGTVHSSLEKDKKTVIVLIKFLQSYEALVSPVPDRQLPFERNRLMIARTVPEVPVGILALDNG